MLDTLVYILTVTLVSSVLHCLRREDLATAQSGLSHDPAGYCAWNILMCFAVLDINRVTSKNLRMRNPRRACSIGLAVKTFSLYVAQFGWF